MSFTVAIVGRPNVGKSTLFNRLVGASRALVDPTPGVTRDRISGQARLGHLRFTAVDTAGLDEGPPESLEGRLRQQTAAALAEADVALMLIDAKSGLTALDRHFAALAAARRTRRSSWSPTNARAWPPRAWRARPGRSGSGAPVPISAQNGEGWPTSRRRSSAHDARGCGRRAGRAARGPAPAHGDRRAAQRRQVLPDQPPDRRGAPADRARARADPRRRRGRLAMAGAARSSWSTPPDCAAGRASSRAALEQLSSRSALAALRQAEVVVLMVDASAPLEQQDLTIANRAAEAGRALVVAANKWDLVEEPQAALALLRERLESRLPHLKGIAVPADLGAHRQEPRSPAAAGDRRRTSAGRARLPTAPLNRWLAEAVAAASAADGQRPPRQDPLRHPGERAPADLRAVREPGRRAAANLPALPDQQPARSVRPAGRAAPPAPAHRQESVTCDPWRARPRFRRRR